MEHPADLTAPGRRMLTCGRGTARAMARASVRLRLGRPQVAVLLLLVGALGGLPLAFAGYPVGGIVEGAAAVVLVAGVLLATTYRRALASATTLCPPGSRLVVTLHDHLLRVRNAVGEQESPYSAFRAPRIVEGQVLLPLRAVRAHITLPAGLLAPDDVAWLRERVAGASADATPQTRRPVADDDQPWAHEVLLSAEVVGRLSRALARYHLLGRGALVRGALAIVLLLWMRVVTGRWLVAAGVALGVVALLVLLVVVGSARTLRRQSSTPRTLRTRFDDTHLHLDNGGAQGSLAYAAIRRCVVYADAVLLLTRTGILQVLPREVVPDDALTRIRAASRAGSAH